MAVIANDPFKGWPDDPRKQGRKVRQVTPSDVDELKTVAKALFITGTGNICVEPADGYEQADGTAIVGGVIFAVTAGQTFDLFQVRKVYATNTTATCEVIV
jgi:hypothetical protein